MWILLYKLSFPVNCTHVITDILDTVCALRGMVSKENSKIRSQESWSSPNSSSVWVENHIPFASADLNDISPTGEENRKGKKKKPTQAPSWSGWHILAHPWRWGLAVCPAWTHIFTSLVSCWHGSIHTSSISGTQSLQLKWYPSAEHPTDAGVDSNISCPQTCSRVWIRAREAVRSHSSSQAAHHTCGSFNLKLLSLSLFGSHLGLLVGWFVLFCFVFLFFWCSYSNWSNCLIPAHHGPTRGNPGAVRGSKGSFLRSLCQTTNGEQATVWRSRENQLTQVKS